MTTSAVDAFTVVTVVVAVLGVLVYLTRLLCPQFIVSGLMIIVGSIGLGHGCYYTNHGGPPSAPTRPYYSSNPEPAVLEADHKNYRLAMQDYEQRRLEWNAGFNRIENPPIMPIWVSLWVGGSFVILGALWITIRLMVRAGAIELDSN